MKTTEIKAEIAELKKEHKLQLRKEHKTFYKEYRGFFIFLDVCVALIVLMNFGALALTNVLLTETKIAEGITPRYYEVNPAAAAIGKLPTVEDVAQSEEEVRIAKENLARLLQMALFVVIFWVALITFYIWNRIHIHNHKRLLALTIGVMWYFAIIGLDFFNNYGLWLGKIIFVG